MSGCALHLFRGAVIEILSDIVVRADRKSICLPIDAASFLAWQVPEGFLRISLAQCGIVSRKADWPADPALHRGRCTRPKIGPPKPASASVTRRLLEKTETHRARTRHLSYTVSRSSADRQTISAIGVHVSDQSGGSVTASRLLWFCHGAMTSPVTGHWRSVSNKLPPQMGPVGLHRTSRFSLNQQNRQQRDAASVDDPSRRGGRCLAGFHFPDFTDVFRTSSGFRLTTRAARARRA
ncbi:hypothetical protein SAMN03159288_05069 [Rhizobium sp. NFACC06-2]|nr:hypothetical protein SAMN03159288_05069 [Rhizobium sp. NFACC06-2]